MNYCVKYTDKINLTRSEGEVVCKPKPFGVYSPSWS
jgi:hypothetical protein